MDINLEPYSKMTKRELEILTHLLLGKSNKEIARDLSLTIRTVKFHTGNIYKHIGVSSRSEAISKILMSKFSN